MTVIPRHRVSPFGEPDDKLRQGIQYAVLFEIKPNRRGILDHPRSQMMTTYLDRYAPL